MSFLKTALAPADFGTGTFTGIPDSFDGKVLCKSWNYTGSLPALTDGLPTYIVSLPIPGVAYLYGQVSAGAMFLHPVYYADVSSIFPTGYEATNVSDFRYAGMALEIIPTVNSYTWTGSVQVFRGPVKFSTQAVSATAISYDITGLAQLCNSSKPDAVHPFNMGCFCVSRQTEPEYPFHGVTPATIFNEVPISNNSSGNSIGFNDVTTFTGFGSMEAIIYKIPSYSATGNGLTLRTWAFTEMKVTSSSALYEYAHISPPHDPAAIALVKRAFNELELCVPFYENDGMWQSVLNFIKRAAEVLSFVPGPVGEIATGTSIIAEAISAMSL